MTSLKSDLRKLIDEAVTLGLQEKYIKEADDFLEHHEYGLCLDTIINRLYEYDKHISLDYYHLIEKIARHIKLPEDEYEYVKVLIKL